MLQQLKSFLRGPLSIILARHGLDIAKMLAGPMVLVGVGFVAAR